MSGRISTRLTGWVVCVLMLLGVASQAGANLITNGDFETGDLTGWGGAPDPVWDGVDTQSPQSGLFAAFFGSPTGSNIAQTIATIAGGKYTVDFWLQTENDVTGNAIPNSFGFDWDGASVMTLTDAPGGSGYIHYSFLLTASSTSTTLLFSFQSTPAFWDFDTVSVDAATSVPEPGSLALIGLACSLIAVARRKRG